MHIVARLPPAEAGLAGTRGGRLRRRRRSSSRGGGGGGGKRRERGRERGAAQALNS